MIAPDARVAQHQREACAMLIGGEGWRALLAHIVDQLTVLDRAIYEPTTPEAVRMQYIGQHKALLGLVAWVCRTAGVPNPFDLAKGALWGQLAPKLPAEVPTEAERREDLSADEKREAVAQMRRERQRGGGGVA